MDEGYRGAAEEGEQRVERVAIVSTHTCPLDQPGTGDSGGMNVVIRSVARRLAEMGIHVDIFTRRAGEDQALVQLDRGVRCVHLDAGPAAPVPKERLVELLPDFLDSLLAFEQREAVARGFERPFYDVVHSHYWLSGWVGRRAAERWRVPLVHSFHTLGRVKNLTVAEGDAPEPPERIAGEDEVVAAADSLLVATAGEAAELVHLYDADPERVRIVPPGVEAALFTPGDRAEARRLLGLEDRPTVLFVGRLQPLKAPDIAVRTLARLVETRPELDAVLLVLGGPSGARGISPESLAALAAQMGIADRVRVVPPVSHELLPEYYRAADVVLVPSRSESFGLVALEAAACGTPVVATDVGGLRTTVRDGSTGLLVPGGDPERLANALGRLLTDEGGRRCMGRAGARFARLYDWRQAALGQLAVYEEMAARRAAVPDA